MITVSWQPGNLKGYSVNETSQMIVEALQKWQSICGVRFATGPLQQAQMRFYPYSGNMNGAFMGTYISTGQIIYSTNLYAPRHQCVMAIMHEIGHYLSQSGTHSNRDEALMHPRGSSVMYFDHIEAQAVWRRFGKFTGYHFPYSLTFVGDKVKARKSEWENLDKEWKALRVLRDAEKNQTKRNQLNTQVLAKLAERNKKHEELVKVNTQWLRIKREWDSIGGIKTPNSLQTITHKQSSVIQEEDKFTGICECFKTQQDNPNALQTPVDMKEVYENLPNLQVPVPGL